MLHGAGLMGLDSGSPAADAELEPALEQESVDSPASDSAVLALVLVLNKKLKLTTIIKLWHF